MSRFAITSYFALFFLVCIVPLQGQEKEDFFIAPLAEALLYSPNSFEAGGGLALGYGTGAAIGIRLLYAFDSDKHGILEILFFLRYYLGGSNARTGPFLQLNGGPVLFTYDGIGTIRERVGTISAGLSFGWRFPFGEKWFIEPAVRAGYPYIAGAGVSAGLRL